MCKARLQRRCRDVGTALQTAPPLAQLGDAGGSGRQRARAEEHVGELPERRAEGRGAGLGPGSRGGDGRLGAALAGIIPSDLQDGHPVPFIFPLGIAWDAGAPWLVVVLLS
ncbi:Protocadherin-11 X-linked [Manis javanica]|nr:Protocadherin-11 X-linked [Manis javanica]